MKKIIKKFFNLLGFEITRLYFPDDIKLLTFDEIYQLKVKNKKPIIFDVGANKGQSIDRFLKINNNSLIHSFEPNIDEFNYLKKKYGSCDNIKLNNIAVGREKTSKILNITGHSGSSSFFNFKKDTRWIKLRSKQLGIKQEDYITKKIEVEVDTIDSYCEINKIDHIDIMKVDTQLFEEEVLIGSKNMIKDQKIDAIELEITFSSVYDKYFNFSDLEKYLIQNGYRFSAIRLNNNNIFTGSIFFADVLFLSKKKFDI